MVGNRRMHPTKHTIRHVTLWKGSSHGSRMDFIEPQPDMKEALKVISGWSTLHAS